MYLLYFVEYEKRGLSTEDIRRRQMNEMEEVGEEEEGEFDS